MERPLASFASSASVRKTLGILVVVTVLSGGCGGASSSRSAPASPETSAATSNPPSAEPARQGEGAAPARELTIAEARRYMLELINRDRKSMGLGPVTLDDGAPTAAGQAHAEDMARNGYLGHWGLDGSVPEQRLTEAGGGDMVLENASCFTDERPRTLDREPRIDAAQVERTESMFFHEVPPNDGHRKNILKPWHTRVGIGIAQPRATRTEIPVPCIAQEFVDAYGSYRPVPRESKVGGRLHVEATLAKPAAPLGVGLARVEMPRALSATEANARRAYPVPQPYQMYWTQGYVTPIPVTVTGQRLAVDIPLDDRGKPGLYELSIWAKLPGSPDPQIVSLRTIRVHPRADE
jgi:uncharacterized protein YkwD